MAAYLEQLLGKAFKSMPGMAYNRYREAAMQRSPRPRLFYEVSLMEERPWAYLRDRVYPAFARYLHAKSIDPESGKDVVVAVFHGGKCHLMEGQAFLQVFCEMEGLDPTAFHDRVLRWLSV